MIGSFGKKIPVAQKFPKIRPTSEFDGETLQSDLNQLVSWTSEWQMHFNVEKMQSIAHRK